MVVPLQTTVIGAAQLGISGSRLRDASSASSVHCRYNPRRLIRRYQRSHPTLLIARSSLSFTLLFRGRHYQTNWNHPELPLQHADDHYGSLCCRLDSRTVCSTSTPGCANGYKPTVASLGPGPTPARSSLMERRYRGTE